MTKIKILFFILTWIPVALAKAAAAIVGLVVVPFGIALDWPKLLWLWGNDEDGCPAWWLEVARNKHWLIRHFPRWWWFAVRNPVNNSRFILDDTGPRHIVTNWRTTEAMEAAELLAVNQRVARRWVWRGMLAGYRRVWLNGNGRYSELWIGWKLGSAVPGLGFAMQLRLKRQIGT
jgi:hypothetical protein